MSCFLSVFVFLFFPALILGIVWEGYAANGGSQPRPVRLFLTCMFPPDFVAEWAGHNFSAFVSLAQIHGSMGKGVNSFGGFVASIFLDGNPPLKSLLDCCRPYLGSNASSYRYPKFTHLEYLTLWSRSQLAVVVEG